MSVKINLGVWSVIKGHETITLIAVTNGYSYGLILISIIQNMDLNVLLAFKYDFVSRIIDRFLMITLQLVLLLDIKINNTTTTVQ